MHNFPKQQQLKLPVYEAKGIWLSQRALCYFVNVTMYFCLFTYLFIVHLTKHIITKNVPKNRLDGRLSSRIQIRGFNASL